MDSTRKLWIPSCHEGSQANELGGYEALINAISKAIAEEKKKYDEDVD